MKVPITIDEAMHDPKLLGAALGDTASWKVWSAVAKASYGLRLTATERTAFDKVAGGRNPPTRKVREFVGVASRRSGKGRIAAALATYESAIVDHRQHLSPGETGVCATISPTKAQSNIILNYCRGYFESSPLLRSKVKDITQDEIRLKNEIVITTLVNDFRSLRGRTLLFVALDEAAFLRDDQSSTPDVEAARALRPGLSTTDGLLAILSSPYSRRGLLHQRYRDHFGQDSDDTLVVAGPSQVFNPTLNAAMIEAERAADPAAAESEWFGLFRSDLAAFLSDDLIDAAIEQGRPLELPPREGISYKAFVDMSGGRHDASCIAIGHRENERTFIDLVRGVSGPHDPASVTVEFSALAKEYHCGRIVGDAYSGEWVAAAYREAGIEYVRSEHPKATLYLEMLPLFTRSAISIPNNAPLLRELRLLERRTARSGRDSVDHGPSGTDDFCNALAGTAWLCRPAKIDRNNVDLGSPAQIDAGPCGFDDLSEVPMADRINPSRDWLGPEHF